MTINQNLTTKIAIRLADIWNGYLLEWLPEDYKDIYSSNPDSKRLLQSYGLAPTSEEAIKAKEILTRVNQSAIELAALVKEAQAMLSSIAQPTFTVSFKSEEQAYKIEVNTLKYMNYLMHVFPDRVPPNEKVCVTEIERTSFTRYESKFTDPVTGEEIIIPERTEQVEPKTIIKDDIATLIEKGDIDLLKSSITGVKGEIIDKLFKNRGFQLICLQGFLQIPDAKELYSLGKDIVSSSNFIEIKQRREVIYKAADDLEAEVDKVIKDTKNKEKVKSYLRSLVHAIGDDELHNYRERVSQLVHTISSDLNLILTAKNVDGEIAIDTAKALFKKLLSSFKLDEIHINGWREHTSIKVCLERTYLWAAGKIYSNDEIIKDAENKLNRVIDETIIIPGNRVKAKEFLPTIIKAVNNPKSTEDFQERVDYLVDSMSGDLQRTSSHRVICSTSDFIADIVLPEGSDSTSDSTLRFAAARSSSQLSSLMDLDQGTADLLKQIYLFATGAM